ncbi:MAG: mechanosensitive ion channel family protein [Nocardioidaceae bacterium]
MLPHTVLWDATPTCARDDHLCNYVKNITGNARLAEASDWLIAKPLAILGIIVVAFAVRWVLHRLIDRLANRAAGGLPSPMLRNRRRTDSTDAKLSPAVAAGRRVQRAKTMASLLKSVTSIVIMVVFGIMAIAELGYPIGPLLASAGIVGIAVGFGAQNLVGDFLAGFCMIFEDQYGVGDAVDLGEASGTVEAVGLRVTRLRDVEGTVWYVRNGQILRVGNQSQNWARTVLDIPVSHRQDMRRVQEVLKDVAHDLWDDEDYKGRILEEPEVWGVQELTPDWVTVRVVLKTAPLEQWGIAREMRQRIMARFDYEKIDIAIPARVLWHKDMPGTATAADGAAVPGGTSRE